MSTKRGGQAPRRHTELTRALAREIDGARNAADLSQQELATLAGMSMTTYQRIEAGTRPPTMEQVEVIALALGMPLSTIVRRAEERVRGEQGQPQPRGVVAFTNRPKRPVNASSQVDGHDSPKDHPDH